jgi:L-ascorbate metabolism protein UlaG (beta-lactamase superfamily)
MKVCHLKKYGSAILSFIFFCSIQISAQNNDSLAIHWVGHGSLYFEFSGMVIHVDPYSSVADYSTLPDADLIFITHGHGDHYDLNALNEIIKDSTLMICTQAVRDEGSYTDTAVVLNNWDSAVFRGIPVKAVPAYNFPPGGISHEKGIGNGYIFTFNDLKVYVAGDTEDIDEMAELGKIHIAFLPMNIPYTMTPEQAANAAEMIKPNILYIYHFGNSDTAYFRTLVANEIADVRIGESLRYEKTTDLDFPTDLEKNYNNSGIKIFPNPTGKLLQVSNFSPGSSLWIYNTSGNLVLNQSLETNEESHIDLATLPSGYYVVRIMSRENQEYFPLVKL